MLKNLLFTLSSTLIIISLAASNSVINKAMSFSIDRVLARYQKDYKVSPDLAKKREIEIKRYLILCSLYPEAKLHMFSKEIDDLWHTFILFTKDYEKFCKTISNRFIHHNPFAQEDKNKAESKKSYSEFVNKYKEVFNQMPWDNGWKSELDCCGGERCDDCASGACDHCGGQ